MSITLRSIGVFGVLLFGLLFSVTFISPEVVENSAKGFIKYQIEKEVRETHQVVIQSNVAIKALDIAGRLGFEKEKIQEDLDSKLPEKIASLIASMCGYDCEKKKVLAQSIASSYLERIKSIELAQNTLGDFVKGKYIEIVGNLKVDLRIFLGTNFLMFLILFTVSFTRVLKTTARWITTTQKCFTNTASHAVVVRCRIERDQFLPWFRHVAS
jgi:hypothetical protein